MALLSGSMFDGQPPRSPHDPSCAQKSQDAAVASTQSGSTMPQPQSQPSSASKKSSRHVHSSEESVVEPESPSDVLP